MLIWIQKIASAVLIREQHWRKIMLVKKEICAPVSAKNLKFPKIPEGGGATAFIQRSAAPKKAELGPHAKRLDEIRHNIGLSLEKYASLLEISNARLATYIYGRHDFQPDKRPAHAEIMRRAEDLAVNYKDLMNHVRLPGTAYVGHGLCYRERALASG